MIRTIIIIILIIFSPTHTKAEEIILFNHQVLGKKLSENINPLENTTEINDKKIEPKIIQLDTENGIYVAASIFYLVDEINFPDLVKFIDSKFPKAKNINLSSDNLVFWRVENEKFVINVSSEEEDGMYRVIYIKFMPTEKILKQIKKTIKYMNN